MSITSVLEIQAGYIGRLIQAMRDHHLPTLSAKRSAADTYNEWITRRLNKMVWYEVTNYWRADGGKGKIFTHYPGSVARLMWEHTNPVWKDWEGAAPVVRWRRVRRALWFVVLLLVGYWGGRRTAVGRRVLAAALTVVGPRAEATKGMAVRYLPGAGRLLSDKA